MSRVMRVCSSACSLSSVGALGHGAAVTIVGLELGGGLATASVSDKGAFAKEGLQFYASHGRAASSCGHSSAG